MDPERTLLQAFECLMEEDEEGIAEHLASYADWRKQGGFEPLVQATLGVGRRVHYFHGDHLAEIIIAAAKADDRRWREIERKLYQVEL